MVTPTGIAGGAGYTLSPFGALRNAFARRGADCGARGVIVHSDQGTQCPSTGFGQDATLLITTGSPLDDLANIEQACIVGREFDMEDIHGFFFEKYMEKPGQQIQVIFRERRLDPPPGPVPAHHRST